MKIAVVFQQVMALHKRLALPPVNQMPGHVWTHQLDAHWFVAMNANLEPRILGPDNGEAHPFLVRVHPFSCGVWFNGWYAGQFDHHDGVLLAGATANEDVLIEALRKAIDAVPVLS